LKNLTESKNFSIHRIEQLNCGGDATVNTPCFQQRDFGSNPSIHTMVTSGSNTQDGMEGI
jgi:hypothetical protein